MMTSSCRITTTTATYYRGCQPRRFCWFASRVVILHLVILDVVLLQELCSSFTIPVTSSAYSSSSSLVIISSVRSQSPNPQRRPYRPTKRQHNRWSLSSSSSDSNTSNNSTNIPDLFDYFDPLISPHSYPKGIIIPDKTTGTKGVETRQSVQESNEYDDNDDDPLLSKYGKRNYQRSLIQQEQQQSTSKRFVKSLLEINEENEDEIRSSELLSSFVDTYGDESSLLRPKQETTTTSTGGDVDLINSFDPLVSPHSYPNGIADAEQSYQTKTSRPPPLFDPTKIFPPDEMFIGSQLFDTLHSNIVAALQDNNEDDEKITTSTTLPTIENDDDKPDRRRPRSFLDIDDRDESTTDDVNFIDTENTEDLFDYFDPLLSPHMYPKGIDSSTKSRPVLSSQSQPIIQATTNKKKSTIKPFGIRLDAEESSTASSLERSDDTTTDLFDYFDPLLSPHMYPKGISSEQPKTSIPEPPRSSSSTVKQQRTFGLRFDLIDQNTNATSTKTYTKWQPLEYTTETKPTSNVPAESITASSVVGSTDVPPISSTEVKVASTGNTPVREPPAPKIVARATERREQRVATSSVPSGQNAMGFNFRTTATIITRDDLEGAKESKGSTTKNPPLLRTDDSSSDNTKQRTSVVGILLIDHGSRNTASNRRLQVLAKLYKKRIGSQLNDDPTRNNNNGDGITFVVRGAHMEIAKPSIDDGIQSLLRSNVTEIICHPYFLSPGRHVTKDIPSIIETIRTTTNIEIPIRITDPIGSNTDFMLSAMDDLIQPYNR